MKEPYFDIDCIVDLLKKQEPDRVDLIEQLRNVGIQKWVRKPYISLVSSERPNQPGSEWQLDECVVLEHATEGTIVIDVLKNGRIGGIEFVDQIRD